MKFNNCATNDITHIIVSSGDLINGNTIAIIEFFTDDPRGNVWYIEYGNNPIRKLVGECGIKWLNEDENEFEIINPLLNEDEVHQDSDDDN